MQLVDGLASGLVVVAAGALAFGTQALAAASDLHALYWSVVGAAALRAAVSLCRQGAPT